MQRVFEGYRKIGVRPVAGGVGAAIEGADLRRLEDATVAEIRRAFSDHLVLVFRNQNLTGREMEAFAERLGPLSRIAYINPIEGAAYTTRLLRLPEAKPGARNYGDRWHTDQSIRPVPPKALILQSVDCPPYGGDTMFSNLELAYETLSDGMKALCERLVVVHTMSSVFGSAKKPVVAEGSVTSFRFSDEEFAAYVSAEVEHPLVCVDPGSGRKFLYVTGAYCVRFRGMTEAESKPILDYLHEHATRAEFTCRIQWQQGSLVLSDNLRTLHFAVNDYAGFRREMYRLEIAADAPPVGPAMPARRIDNAA